MKKRKEPEIKGNVMIRRGLSDKACQANQIVRSGLYPGKLNEGGGVKDLLARLYALTLNKGQTVSGRLRPAGT